MVDFPNYWAVANWCEVAKGGGGRGGWLKGGAGILLLLAIKQQRNLHFPANFIKVTMDSCGR